MTEEVAVTNRLGFVEDPAPGHERFQGWLAIPYLTVTGPVAIKFRCISDHDCKAVKCQRYDSPPGQKARLYNAVALARPVDVLLVCEGEMDTLVGESQLGVPAVGTPGTQWMDHWTRCLGDVERTLVVADHDAKEDGSDPGLKHAKAVVKEIPGAELILPPSGMDLGEWLAVSGPDDVRKAMSLG